MRNAFSSSLRRTKRAPADRRRGRRRQVCECERDDDAPPLEARVFLNRNARVGERKRSGIDADDEKRAFGRRNRTADKNKQGKASGRRRVAITRRHSSRLQPPSRLNFFLFFGRFFFSFAERLASSLWLFSWRLFDFQRAHVFLCANSCGGDGGAGCTRPLRCVSTNWPPWLGFRSPWKACAHKNCRMFFLALSVLEPFCRLLVFCALRTGALVGSPAGGAATKK